MTPRLASIPPEDLVSLNVLVHPGFRRIIKIRAAEEGIMEREFVHNVLEYVLGDPGPVKPQRKPLVAARPS